MKYLYLFAVLFAFTSFAQTTTTEYNYLTKGYKLDQETGRDIKNGYFIEQINGTSSNIKFKGDDIKRAVHLFAFKKIKDSTTVALLAELLRHDTKVKNYVCIPHPNSNKEVLNKARDDFYKFNGQGVNETNVKTVHYYWNTLKLLGMAYMK